MKPCGRVSAAAWVRPLYARAAVSDERWDELHRQQVASADVRADAVGALLYACIRSMLPTWDDQQHRHKPEPGGDRVVVDMAFQPLSGTEGPDAGLGRRWLVRLCRSNDDVGDDASVHDYTGEAVL